MNYQRNLRKKAIVKRIIITWLIVAIVFLLIGTIIGYAIKSNKKAKQTTESEQEARAEPVQSVFVEPSKESSGKVNAVQVYTSWKIQTISLEEFEAICRVVMNEAGGESYKCQVAVAETIINRINSDKFPDTLMEVLNQPYQFSHNENGKITDSVREAVAQSLEYQIFDTDMVYFREDYYFSFAEKYMCIDNLFFSVEK